MRLIKILSFLITLFFLFIFFPKLSYADTSIYRSAGWVATDGNIPYGNTTNCQSSDGVYCSRPSAAGAANLYFSSFGTLSDFGIPAGSYITKVRIKITGRNDINQFIGVKDAKNYMPFTDQCQFPADLWTFFGGDINTEKEFQTYTVSNSLIGCIRAENIDMEKLTFRLNRSSSSAWFADIDNFQISFDYVLPFTHGPAWINQDTHRMYFSEYAAVLLNNGKVLATGGEHLSIVSRNSKIYTHGPNGTGEWDNVTDMNKPRIRHTLNLLSNQKVLAAGGHPETTGKTAELYDPSVDIWTPTPNMNYARGDHASSMLPDGKVLVTGGYMNSATNTTEIYDPVANTWTVKAPLNIARGDHQQITFTDAEGNTKVMVIGGTNLSQGLSSTEIYDSVANNWSMGPSLNSARYHFSAVKLHDGRILVNGGDMGYNSEVYNPVTNEWTMLPNAYQFRWGAMVVLGEDENYKVLASGGLPGVTDAAVKAMIFDPTTNLWTNTVDMTSPRYNFSLVLLPNGTVLAAGGNTIYSNATTSEVFVPTEDNSIANRQIVFIHGIRQSYVDAQVCTNNGFQTILCDGSIHDSVHLFSYYQDLAYRLEDETCDAQPLPNTNTGSLHAHPDSISSSICDSQSAIAYNSTKLSDLIKTFEPLDVPVAIMNYSLGAPITRGWLTLAQTTVGDTTLDIVDTVISFQGVHKGSYVAYGPELVTIASFIAPYPAVRALFIALPSVIKELTGLDFDRPAQEDLTPYSDWYISANQVLPTDLHYFNFYSDIKTNLYPRAFWVDLNPIATVSLGDLVVLPGDPDPSTLNLSGGARFLPGGTETADRHEYQLESNHDFPVGVALFKTAEAIGALLTDPIMHTNLYEHLDDADIRIASCQDARGDVTIKEEVLRIIEDPANACDN